MNEQDKFEQLLAQSRPQADADFQRALEEKLVARLRERKVKMNGTLRLKTVYPPARRNTTPIRFSITLAAAAVVVVLMVAIVFMMNNHSPEKSPGGANHQVVSATPSRIPSATGTPFPFDPAACTVQTWHPMYLTREGDTLAGIAEIFDVPVDVLRAVNCFDAETVLDNRMMIFVPVNVPTPAVTRPDSTVATVLPTIVPPVWTATPIGNTMVTVIMSIQEISENVEITDSMLTEVLVPAEHRPANTFESRAELVGKTTRDDIDRWEFVEAEDIAD